MLDVSRFLQESAYPWRLNFVSDVDNYTVCRVKDIIPEEKNPMMKDIEIIEFNLLLEKLKNNPRASKQNLLNFLETGHILVEANPILKENFVNIYACPNYQGKRFSSWIQERLETPSSVTWIGL